jgi:hypothetical protein
MTRRWRSKQEVEGIFGGSGGVGPAAEDKGESQRKVLEAGARVDDARSSRDLICS